MEERLIIPTLSGFKDMLRPAISDEKSRMALLNVQNEDFVFKGHVLYHRSKALSENEIFDLIAEPKINRPLDEPVLVNAIFSFLYLKRDLRNQVEFETSINELNSFMGVSTGAKGFRLVEKLEALSNIYGVISGVGVFPLLEVRRFQNKLILTSHYFHQALNMMLTESVNRYGERGIYYTDKVHASLVAERNKTAALIVIELARLIVTAGRRGKPHITLSELALRIPQLYAIWSNPNGTSFQNRQLHRAFSKVKQLMADKTKLPKAYPELSIEIPVLQVSKPDAVIHIRHKGNEIIKKEAVQAWRKNYRTKS